MGFENLQSVKFLLPWVTHVGNGWLSYCATLKNPSFVGMSSLVEVGTHWMDRCDTLANPSFTGLSSLEKVGSYGHKKVEEYFIEQIRYYNEIANRAYNNAARELREYNRQVSYNNMLLNNYI